MINYLARKNETNGNLWKIYCSGGIRAFSISLLSLFVPLYLHQQLGYSLPETLYFFIIFAVMLAISSPLAAAFVTRYGIRKTIFLSIPLYLIYVASLYSLSFIPIPLYFIGTVMGFSIGFYWMGMHLAFYYASDLKHRGEEVSIRDGLSIGAGTIGPIIGGFLIKYVGFNIVFLIATILLFSSGFVLLGYTEKQMTYHFSLRPALNRRQWKLLLYFISRGGIIIAEGVLWPLYLFVIVQDYFSLGMLGTLLTGIGALLVWFSGKWSDHLEKRKMVRTGMILSMAYWFVLPLVNTITRAFSVTLYGAIPYGLLQAPLGALEYDQANGDIVNYFVMREIFFCLGRILMLAFVLIVDSLTGGFIFAGLMNLAALLI